MKFIEFSPIKRDWKVKAWVDSQTNEIISPYLLNYYQARNQRPLPQSKTINSAPCVLKEFSNFIFEMDVFIDKYSNVYCIETEEKLYVSNIGSFLNLLLDSNSGFQIIEKSGILFKDAKYPLSPIKFDKILRGTFSFINKGELLRPAIEERSLYKK